MDPWRPSYGSLASATDITLAPMRYGIALPTGGECGEPRFLVELAERAEAAGWDAVFLEDYVCYQGDPRIPTCDTWVALAAIAVRTKAVRLGVEVTPLARRRPWKVAREAAGIDQLSGGRMILGAGSGDANVPGFSVCGDSIVARVRAERLEEGLQIVAGLWTGEPFSFRGKHFTVDDVAFLPRPVQQPRIPIWIGGGYPPRRPTERALRWDGSCLYRQNGEMTHLGPDDVRALRASRPDPSWDISAGGEERPADWHRQRDLIRAIEEAGATWWVEWVRPADAAQMRAVVPAGPRP
jgi:alkanesulfonate monooxygenase SsuD/methylene tetrahydromethanopterin reductase-like flavin-dependent oxidoreductase (luciferase family)